MAGYSGKPLAQKLGLKEGHRVWLRGAPAGFRRTLGAVPEGVRFVADGAEPIDVAIVFACQADALQPMFAVTQQAITPNGMLWVAWPKRASKLPTDLTEDRVRAIGLECGLVDVKVCAIDETWSGLKFVWRLKDRP